MAIRPPPSTRAAGSPPVAPELAPRWPRRSPAVSADRSSAPAWAPLAGAQVPRDDFGQVGEIRPMKPKPMALTVGVIATMWFSGFR